MGVTVPFPQEDCIPKWFTELDGQDKAEGRGKMPLVLQDLTLAHTNTEYDFCIGRGVQKWRQGGVC